MDCQKHVCCKMWNPLLNPWVHHMNHFRKNRKLSQPKSVKELFVAWHGPSLNEADNMLKMAMHHY